MIYILVVEVLGERFLFLFLLLLLLSWYSVIYGTHKKNIWDTIVFITNLSYVSFT
jgi:cbb3-type cytochrome oxidase subunit 3